MASLYLRLWTCVSECTQKHIETRPFCPQVLMKDPQQRPVERDCSEFDTKALKRYCEVNIYQT